MKLQDAIRILGLITPFTADEAKTAYRRKALIAHPDKGGTHEQFIKVKEAYEICKFGSEYRKESFKINWDVGVEASAGVYTVPNFDRDGMKDVFKRYHKAKKEVKFATKVKVVSKWFYTRMLDKIIRKNGHKGMSWRQESLSSLFNKLGIEMLELVEAIEKYINNKHKSGNKEAVIEECVDMAAFAMFIADKVKISK
jgi:curved DNA-binding protein CbpA